jgi:hypothetical protein
MFVLKMYLYLNRVLKIIMDKNTVLQVDVKNKTVDTNEKKIAQEKRIRSAKAPVPPSPASSEVRNLAQELAELNKLFRDKRLSEEELKTAKKRLID